MESTELWSQRVSAWKASGLTSVAYCEGKPFTPGGLRHWAYRLGQSRRRQQKEEKTPIRIAQVVRLQASANAPETPPAQSLASPPEKSVVEALVIECGAMRVAVRPGFDRGTLEAVLDIVASRGGGR
jgi:hypothetical protein